MAKKQFVDDAEAIATMASGDRGPHLVHRAQVRSKSSLQLMNAFVLHELRSQLNIVTNTCHLLQSYRERLDPRGNRLLEAQQAGAALLPQLVDQLSTIIGHCPSSFEFDNQPLSLAPWLTQWHARTEALSEFSIADVPLELSTPMVEPWIDADPVRLGQCLFNLVSNAYKYGRSPRGVWLSLEVVGQEAELAVRDFGVGLTPEQEGRLFTPYDRMGRDGDQPGQGLGLALTRMLVEGMGGRIQVESSVAHGSRFSLLFPLDQRALPARDRGTLPGH